MTREKILEEMSKYGLSVQGYAEKHKLDVQDVWDIINKQDLPNG